MDIVVEPDSCDPWTRHVLSAGMTCCVLHAAFEEHEQRDGDGGGPAMDELLTALVRRDEAPGRMWVVHVSGPAAAVATVVAEAGHRRRAANPAAADGSADTAHATFVLHPGDRDAAELIGAGHGEDSVIALLGVRSDRAAYVATSLEEGHDVQAVAAADVLITRQPRSGRSTVARREPAARPSPLHPQPRGARRSLRAPVPALRRGPSLRPGAVRDIGLRLSSLHPRHAATRLVGLRWIVGAGAAAAALVVAAVVAVTMPHGQPAPHTAVAAHAPRPAGGGVVAPVLGSPVVGGVAVAAPVPPGRVGAATAADPVRDQVVLFGGTGTDGRLLADTWTFNGTAWSQPSQRRSPSARTGAVAAWDPAIGAVVLFGGTGTAGTPLDDTWAWNGSSWRTLAAVSIPAPAGDASGLTFDTTRQQPVLVTAGPADPARPGVTSGQTWAWSGQRWTRESTPASPALTGTATMTDDPALGGVLLVDVRSSTAWLFDGASWTPASSSGLALSPAAVTHATYDTASHEVVLVQDGQPGMTTSATWSFDGTAWRYDTASGAPVQVGSLTADTTGVLALAGESSASNLGTVSRWIGGVWGPAA